MCPQNMHIFKFLIWEWVLKKGKKKIKYTTKYFKVHSSEMRGLYITWSNRPSKILKSLLFGNTKTQGAKTVVGSFSIYAIPFYCKVIKMKKKLCGFLYSNNMTNVEAFY